MLAKDEQIYKNMNTHTLEPSTLSKIDKYTADYRTTGFNEASWGEVKNEIPVGQRDEAEKKVKADLKK